LNHFDGRVNAGEQMPRRCRREHRGDVVAQAPGKVQHPRTATCFAVFSRTTQAPSSDNQEKRMGNRDRQKKEPKKPKQPKKP